MSSLKNLLDPLSRDLFASDSNKSLLDINARLEQRPMSFLEKYGDLFKQQ